MYVAVVSACIIDIKTLNYTRELQNEMLRIRLLYFIQRSSRTLYKALFDPEGSKDFSYLVGWEYYYDPNLWVEFPKYQQ